MPPLTASGPYSKGLDTMRTALSKSSTFQTLCGVNSSNDALNYIFIEETTTATTKAIAVCLAGKVTLDLIARGHGAMMDTGTVGLFIEAVCPTQYTLENERNLWWLNTVGGICEDLINYGVTYLAGRYTRITNIAGPGKADDAERNSRGNLYGVILEVSY